MYLLLRKIKVVIILYLLQGEKKTPNRKTRKSGYENKLKERQVLVLLWLNHIFLTVVLVISKLQVKWNTFGISSGESFLEFFFGFICHNIVLK